MMSNKYISTEDFIQNQNPVFGLMLWRLRDLILCSDAKMKEKIGFNTPMFSVKNTICYVGTIKAKIGIEIGFYRGFQLVNHQNILEAKNRQFIKGITFKDNQDIDTHEQAFLEIIQEAILLDQTHDKSIFAEVLNNGKTKKYK